MHNSHHIHLVIGHKQSDAVTEVWVLEAMVLLTEVPVQMSYFKLADPWVTHHQHYQQLSSNNYDMDVYRKLWRLELPYMVTFSVIFILATAVFLS